MIVHLEQRRINGIWLLEGVAHVFNQDFGNFVTNYLVIKGPMSYMEMSNLTSSETI